MKTMNTSDSEFIFSVPWPPSVNQYLIRPKGRRKPIKSDKARKYSSMMSVYLKEIGLSNLKLECNLGVEMTLRNHQNRSYDIDNFCKCIFDNLTDANFWIDDKQVHDLHIKKGKKTSGGCVMMRVFKIDDYTKSNESKLK